MAAIANLEEEKAGALEQLEIILTQLKDDPENVELQVLKEELNQMITLLDESLAELKPKQAPPAQKRPETQRNAGGDGSSDVAPAPPSQNPPDAPPPAPEDEPPAPVSYNVNDTVMAKWVSGDKAFYPARITSITGSSTAPIYIVKFKSYDEVDTVRAKDIRPMSHKRKADTTTSVAAASAPAPPPPLATTPGVISAAASMYPEAQVLRDAEKDDGEGAKPPKKKLKAKKVLEAGKNKWQEFSNKKHSSSKGKKDSMFRTPEGIHGRVGFTGSGQAMRKDPTRTCHVYQQNDELD